MGLRELFLSAKVMVIGIDGGTFNIIDPLLAQKRLPVLSKLARTGVRAVLRSSIPPSSAVAWPSLVTGVNPGKHGVYDFFNLVPNTYLTKLVSSRQIAAPRLWQVLNRQGLKAGIVNIPITYPPEPLDGFMVSGLLTPSDQEIFTYPSTLHTELLARVGNLHQERGFLKKFRSGNKIEALNDLYALTRTQTETLKYLMTTKSWDLLFTVYRGTDLLQHVLGKYWNPAYRKKKHKDYLKFKAVIPQFYEELDSQLGELLRLLPDNTTVFVISDHGAGYIKGQFFINQWLLERGYLTLKPLATIRGLVNSLKLRSIDASLAELNLEALSELLPTWMRETPFPYFSHECFSTLVDWRRTSAFALWHSSPTAGIRLNLLGREPKGVIAPGREADRLMQELRDELLAYSPPQGSDRLFAEVYPCAELYHGPCSVAGPDIIAVPHNYEVSINGRLRVETVFHRTNNLNAQHRMEGILFAAGPAIRSLESLSPPSILDIPPTILHLFGIARPEYMDGRVLTEILTEPEDASTACDELQSALTPKPVSEVYSDEQEKLLEDHLRSLGYLD